LNPAENSTIEGGKEGHRRREGDATATAAVAKQINNMLWNNIFES
jgi:hypothetical protein